MERRNAQNISSFLKYNHAVSRCRSVHNLLLWNGTGQTTFIGILLSITLSRGERRTQKIHLFVFTLQVCSQASGKATLSHLLATSCQGKMQWLTAGEHLHASSLHCRALSISYLLDLKVLAQVWTCALALLQRSALFGRCFTLWAQHNGCTAQQGAFPVLRCHWKDCTALPLATHKDMLATPTMSSCA